VLYSSSECRLLRNMRRPSRRRTTTTIDTQTAIYARLLAWGSGEQVTVPPHVLLGNYVQDIVLL
jgi:hypothetical protein